MDYLLDLRQCGSMELGESLEEVAIREMYEESGLTPDNIELLKVKNFIISIRMCSFIKRLIIYNKD